MGDDLHIFAGKTIKEYVDSVLTVTSTVEIPTCTDISGTTAPDTATTGTDIPVLEFPNGSTTGQKFSFAVPEDYHSGDIDIVAQFRPKTGVASPNNVVRLETGGEVVDNSDGDIDSISAVGSDLTLADGTTTIEHATIKTITSGNFGIRDEISLDVKRLGAHGNDTYTDAWVLISMFYRYTRS